MKSIFRLIAIIIAASCWLAAIAMSFASIFYSFDIIASLFGSVVAYISLIFLPILWTATPLYALFAYGYWALLLLTYGAFPPAMLGMGALGLVAKLTED